MKNFLKILSVASFLLIGTFAISANFDVSPLMALTGLGAVSLFTPASVGGLAYMAVPSTNVENIAKWAGQYSQAFFSDMLNDLEVFKQLTVDRNVSRLGKLLPKFSVAAGMRPLDTNIDENGTQERSWSGRMITTKECMKLFKFVPEELHESFLSDMLAPGAIQIPFAKWVWQKEMEKLTSEINDNFYLSEYHADAAAYSGATVYNPGDYIKFTDSSFYKCVTLTSAGESPLTHSAKWTLVNGIVCFDGPAKIIADEITGGGLVPVSTGAISDSNALTKCKDVVDSFSQAIKNKGGLVHVSWDVYEKYLEQEKTEYPQVLDPKMGDGKKFVYGTAQKWQILPATWMGNSQRIIANVIGKHMVVGTNLKENAGVTNTEQKLQALLAVSKYNLGFQLGDLQGIAVNNQA